jgi:hypothetical protein
MNLVDIGHAHIGALRGRTHSIATVLKAASGGGDAALPNALSISYN